jgi:competence protein ComEC
MNPRHTPFLRLFLPWAVGILAGACLEQPIPGLGWVLLGSGILLLFMARKKYAYRYRWVFGTVLIGTLLGAGYWHVVAHDERRQADHFSRICPEATVFCGIVNDSPSKGTKVKIPLCLEAAGTATDSFQKCSGQVLLFIEPSAASEQLRYGDRIWVAAQMRQVLPPKNPHAFDYKRYLHFQNIHFQAFVKDRSFGVLATGFGNPLWRAAFQWRDQLLLMLQEYFPGSDEYAVAAALLLGHKAALSDTLRASYADTGSMHALAVSGMHVGLLYVALLFVLKFMPWRGPGRRWAEAALVLAGIWAFTLVTGATPSVLRASVMFTSYVISKVIRRQASIWNILGASAFVLLFFNPYLLFEVGFQLSYSAVAGIVFFYSKFQKITPPLPKWAAEGWKILLIGVAAQLGTLPLSLYYFHQFPVYFWLAGWVVVLGGAVFLWGGFLLVLLHSVLPEFAEGLGWGLHRLIWGINQIIRSIQQLPGSVWAGIWIEAWTATLLALFILLFSLAVEQRKPRLLLAALLIPLVCSVSFSIQKHRQVHQKKLVLYHTNRHFLLDCFNGEKQLSWTDSLSQRQERFAAQANRWAAGVTEALRINANFRDGNLYRENPFVQFFQKKLVVIDRRLGVYNRAGPPVPVDFLILHDNPNVQLDECLRQFPCHFIVFAASNSRRRVERWKAACVAQKLTFYDVEEKGAWQYTVP